MPLASYGQKEYLDVFNSYKVETNSWDRERKIKSDNELRNIDILAQSLTGIRGVKVVNKTGNASCQFLLKMTPESTVVSVCRASSHLDKWLV